jgi:hypothetical protein
VRPLKELRTLVVAGIAVLASVAAAQAGETVGTIACVARDRDGAPVPNVAVTAASRAARYASRSGRDGRFVFSGVAPERYAVSGEAPGFIATVVEGLEVAPGARVDCILRLERLTLIGSTRGTARAIDISDTQGRYRIGGDEARGLGQSSAAGLGAYTRGTVQSAAGNAPGITQDPFANLIVRGGRANDVAFMYDGVPLPQAVVADPGGNAIGASLETTGTGFVNVVTGGFRGNEDALSGVVDEVAAGGVFPAQSSMTLSSGIVGRANTMAFTRRWATPDLRRRYAVESRIEGDALSYGDGRTFYPAEAATYGLALAARSRWSTSANVHLRVGRHDDDLQLLALAGQMTADQYGTPLAGQTYGEFATATTPFPGAPPDALVRTPTRIRATYAVEKIQLARAWSNGSARVRAYRATSGSTIDAPFFDDLSFPNGAISLATRQTLDTMGLGLDAEHVGSRHTATVALDARRDRLAFDQTIPTFDRRTRSSPHIDALLVSATDRWSNGRWDVAAGLHGILARLSPGDGGSYGAGAIDPRLAVSYRLGTNGRLRIAADVSSQLPKPLEIAPADGLLPRLAPQRARSTEIAYDRAGASTLHVALFSKRETNLIDVLPSNLRAGGAFGIASNAGDLRARGAELAYRNGALSLNATYVRAFSSSASQFGLNDLNAPAIAAHHLFPVSYLPDLVSSASLRLRAGRTTIVPTISYQTGYPYGNGKMVYVFGPDGAPLRVPNDDHVNPGVAYWFLRDPAQPFDPAGNPYIGSMRTNEGDDPNTLRSTPQILVSLRVLHQLNKRATLVLDATNLFAFSRPTQAMSNPYLIGPPGYAGGDPARASWYGAALNGDPYTLGNGVPTNNGSTPSLPWTYGRDGYVPSSYPEARSVRLTLQLTW